VRGIRLGRRRGFDSCQFRASRRWCRARQHAAQPSPRSLARSRFQLSTTIRSQGRGNWPSGFRPWWWAAFSGWPGLALLPQAPGLPLEAFAGVGPLRLSEGLDRRAPAPPSTATWLLGSPSWPDLLGATQLADQNCGPGRTPWPRGFPYVYLRAPMISRGCARSSDQAAYSCIHPRSLRESADGCSESAAPVRTVAGRASDGLRTAAWGPPIGRGARAVGSGGRTIRIQPACGEERQPWNLPLLNPRHPRGPEVAAVESPRSHRGCLGHLQQPPHRKGQRHLDDPPTHELALERSPGGGRPTTNQQRPIWPSPCCRERMPAEARTAVSSDGTQELEFTDQHPLQSMLNWQKAVSSLSCWAAG